MFSLFLKTVFELIHFDAFQFFCHIFCLFHLFHISKIFPFEDFFSLRETNKNCLGDTGWIGVVGPGIHVFGQKLLNTQHGVGKCSVNHPSWNGQIRWKSLQKNSLKLHAASHHNTSWYTDIDGFLGHSPSRGSLYYKALTLQKIVPFMGLPYI